MFVIQLIWKWVLHHTISEHRRCLDWPRQVCRAREDDEQVVGSSLIRAEMSSVHTET